MTKKANRPGSSLEVHYESVLGDISNVIDAARRFGGPFGKLHHDGRVLVDRSAYCGV